MYDYRKEALEYHSAEPKGKLEVRPTKPARNSKDLSLAYSPGVAYPCLEIQRDPDLAYQYTNKGNLVGVITNGTAVLGLGNIGPLAGKPVMEGKAVLFKKFAGIDVYDIEVNAATPEDFIRAVQALEPTFGGINLEDIKAPECFYIEDELKSRMNIPVFHDDQHGTAIVTVAAMINAFHLTGKKADRVKIVVNGAGAAAIAIVKLMFSLGVLKQNVFLLDTKGVIHHNRTDLNEIKKQFIQKTQYTTLDQIIEDADFFIGVSTKDLLTPAMIRKMAKDPCIFAMANPDPEISYPLAKSVRDDIIMGTGRSDYPNQINNVLAFPYIFRGALDVRASRITQEMYLAAAYALAELAREAVPTELTHIYDNTSFEFNKEYLIPKPFDSRALFSVAPAVAEAAEKSGVSRIPYIGKANYVKQLGLIQK